MSIYFPNDPPQFGRAATACSHGNVSYLAQSDREKKMSHEGVVLGGLVRL